MDCAAECCIECYTTSELFQVWIEISFKLILRLIFRYGPIIIVVCACAYTYYHLKHWTCGRARAVSGNTIEIGDQVVRIYGVVALRKGQELNFKDKAKPIDGSRFCKDALAEQVDGKRVCCRIINPHGAYGRIDGVCKLGRLDLGEWLVREGNAFADTAYSRNYLSYEKLARKHNKGFHAARPRTVNPKILEQRGERDAREILVERFYSLDRPGDPAIMTIKELSAEVGLEFKGGVLIDATGVLDPIDLG